MPLPEKVRRQLLSARNFLQRVEQPTNPDESPPQDTAASEPSLASDSGLIGNPLQNLLGTSPWNPRPVPQRMLLVLEMPSARLGGGLSECH
ncbi:hypothetical protein AK830_g3042 [Neonectria ditissima]|uniref:Uncharacterized protein n=1 Tax=Neonectria ditissima TaxID=78410 RepID=A0A0N8H836_9HYPO|nr:hypothetical protein AK830_g3042 [Neonectria ditissima]